MESAGRVLELRVRESMNAWSVLRGARVVLETSELDVMSERPLLQCPGCKEELACELTNFDLSESVDNKPRERGNDDFSDADPARAPSALRGSDCCA